MPFPSVSDHRFKRGTGWSPAEFSFRPCRPRYELCAIHWSAITVDIWHYLICDSTGMVDAHVLGLRWLKDGKGSRVFNLGTGSGFSVREVIDHSRAVTNQVVPYVDGDRRPGDCTKLVSGSTRAEAELGWAPTRSTLETMITDAWKWHKTGHYDS